jgi:predicted porin
MKKTLIALAAVAATGAAFAQSSVTLYGVADIGVGKGNAPAGATGATLGNFSGSGSVGLLNDKFQAVASGVLSNGTSRFGLRGTEDLGGGLKAGFNFEGGLTLATGAGNLSGGTLFARAANVSLMGGFGEIRAGRSLTPSFYSVASYELTGTANYSALANQFNFAGAAPRDHGLVMYRSPSFGGLTVDVGTVLAGNCVNVGAPGVGAGCTTGTPPVATSGKSKMDFAVTYKAGPLTASLAHNKVSGAKGNSAIGGKYDLGVVAIAASYQDPAGAKKGFTLGVSAPMGPVTLTADIARATAGGKNTDFVLEAKYALSKRTFAYGVYLNDGAVTGKSANGFAVGVRHNF